MVLSGLIGLGLDDGLGLLLRGLLAPGGLEGSPTEPLLLAPGGLEGRPPEPPLLLGEKDRLKFNNEIIMFYFL